MPKFIVKLCKLMIGILLLVILTLFFQGFWTSLKLPSFIINTQETKCRRVVEVVTSVPSNSKTGSGVSNSSTLGLWSLSHTTDAIEKRRRQVQEACQTLGYKDNKSQISLARALVSVPRAVVYCPVEKAASTFFRRFMYQLDHTDPMRSPFEVPIKMIYACPFLYTSLQSHADNLVAKQQRQSARTKRKSAPSKVHESGIHQFLDSSTKFLFVRDPYSRLFSAYVDKLLAPNPDYWNKWGKPAIKQFRKQPTEISLRCGHDVTFPEFLSYVLRLNVSESKTDVHLRPIYDMCSPCSLNYTLIGAMDTFERDTQYLYSILNVTESKIEFQKLAADSARDAIEDSVMDAFTDWSARIKKCVPKSQAIQRIWRKLQIRGFISQRHSFPFESYADSLESMEAYDFIGLLIKALKASTDMNELIQQKKQTYLKAYRSVKKRLLRRLASAYSSDFKAFGFDSRPNAFFDRSPEQNIDTSYAVNLTIA